MLSLHHTCAVEKLTEIQRLALVSSLRSASVFAGLPEEDVQRIANYVVIKKLRKNSYLFHENDPADGFFIVRRGMINVHRTSADGREQVIHMFRPGESLAEIALIGKMGYPADARAEEPSEVLLIPRDEFMAHQRDRSDLAWRMLISMSHHLRVLVTSLESLKLKDAETRFMHWLLQRCPADRSCAARVNIGMTKALLASELGTRQETLSRILAKLRDGDLIEVQHNVILVHDPAALEFVFQRNLSGAGSKAPSAQ